MVKIIRNLNKIGNKIELTIHDDDWRKIGHFKFNQSEFPQVCKILKAKYGIEYKPAIPYNDRVNFLNNKISSNSKVATKEISEEKAETKPKEINWLD